MRTNRWELDPKAKRPAPPPVEDDLDELVDLSLAPPHGPDGDLDGDDGGSE